LREEIAQTVTRRRKWRGDPPHARRAEPITLRPQWDLEITDEQIKLKLTTETRRHREPRAAKNRP
jgi:hypothetical protein